jgi:glutamate-1-semialdehyde 2,1-aminomutase
VLIFDEVVTGIRVGLGGAQTFFGITPDLGVFGKCIGGGGVPLSALAGKRDIMQLYEKNIVVHGGTFNGYPLGMAALKATFDILTSDPEGFYNNMSDCMNQIHSIFREEAYNVNLDLIIQGPPTCASFHCTDGEIHHYNEFTNNIITFNGIIRDQMGAYGILVSHMSRLYPNISINSDDVNFFRERIRPALQEAKIVIDRISRTQGVTIFHN